jgi:hypothetical protein
MPTARERTAKARRGSSKLLRGVPTWRTSVATREASTQLAAKGIAEKTAWPTFTKPRPPARSGWVPTRRRSKREVRKSSQHQRA